MEQLIATPVQPLELMVGEMTPYFVIGMFDVLLSVAMAVWVAYYAYNVEGPLDPVAILCAGPVLIFRRRSARSLSGNISLHFSVHRKSLGNMCPAVFIVRQGDVPAVFDPQAPTRSPRGSKTDAIAHASRALHDQQSNDTGANK